MRERFASGGLSVGHSVCPSDGDGEQLSLEMGGEHFTRVQLDAYNGKSREFYEEVRGNGGV